MNVAIIGAGTMGLEIANQLLKNTKIEEVIATRRNISELQKLSGAKLKVTSDNNLAVKAVEIVILAVRPQEMKKVITEISESILSSQIMVSISVGIELRFYEKLLPNNPWVRIMPNPFIDSSLGTIAFSKNANVTNTQITTIQ